MLTSLFNTKAKTHSLHWVLKKTHT